jgi:hypothetical protein
MASAAALIMSGCASASMTTIAGGRQLAQDVEQGVMGKALARECPAQPQDALHVGRKRATSRFSAPPNPGWPGRRAVVRYQN